VDIHAIMVEMRRGEEAPAGHEANLVSVLRSGYALAMSEEINEIRRIHGLEAVELVPVEWVHALVRGQQGRKKGA
jgi:phosphopantetheine adenylyltransferase